MLILGKDIQPVQEKNYREIISLFALALGIRFSLMFFNHPWDLQSWYNMFVDLAHDRSPYETLKYLTESTRSRYGLIWYEGGKILSSKPAVFYEYYAYPPFLIILYYPLAKLYSLFFSLEYSFAIPYTTTIYKVSPLFHLFFKTPIFLCDLGIAFLLYKMSSRKEAKSFLFNPYIILISACWTFESIAVFFLLLSIYLIKTKRFITSSISLALGAVAKFYPLLALPVLNIYFLRQNISWKKILAYNIIFALVCLVVILPFRDGLKFVLDFHSRRAGIGLSLHMILYLIAQFAKGNAWLYYQIISPTVGAFTLTLGLLLSYYYLAKHYLSLNSMILFIFTAYLLFSKVVNEQYIFVLIPFLFLELHQRYSEKKEFIYKAIYSLPLAFAIINVPIYMFTLPFYFSFFKVNLIDLQIAMAAYARAMPLVLHGIILFSIAALFVIICIYTLKTLAKEKFYEKISS